MVIFYVESKNERLQCFHFGSEKRFYILELVYIMFYWHHQHYMK